MSSISTHSASTLVSRDKKEQILAVAKARFLHYGVSKTTMRELADDLGISVSNLYLYFENKREIVLAIAQECRCEQERIDQTLLDDESIPSAQKLEMLLLRRFQKSQAFRQDSPRGKELMAYLLQEAPTQLLDWQHSLEASIQAILEAGIWYGDFCLEDPAQSAHLFYLAVEQYFLPVHIDLPTPPVEEDLRALIRWILAPRLAPAADLPRQVSKPSLPVSFLQVS
jgi:TetR/AcrR family transcriptional regulator